MYFYIKRCIVVIIWHTPDIGGDMLEKILKVKGVGLFHDVNGGRYELQKASIIYADNGRGKSTLVSLLRSCSTNNPELLLKRRTIPGDQNLEVDLLFSDGQHSKFENGCWDVKRPELLTFDADFIEQNVYAGGQVTTEQRRNLLEFALGENAVVETKEYNKADQDVTTAADVVAKTTSQLSNIHKGLTLTEFQDIPKVPDADDQTATLNKKITESQNIGSIQSKPLPRHIVEPTLNIEPFFDILGKSLADIDKDAEQQVKKHLNIHNKPQLEKWISDGHAYGEEENCLFCNQPLESVKLIQAYRSYFNQDYKRLKSNVVRLAGLITEICSNDIIYKLEARFDATIECINEWQQYIKITTPTFDKNAARNALANTQSLLEKLKQSKEANLLEGIGSEDDKNKVVKEWQTILDVVIDCNNSISNVIKLITAYKDNLATLNIEDLRQQVRDLEMAKTRYRQDVIELCVRIETELTQEKNARKKKEMKKGKLDKVLTETLDRYKDRINELLRGFGAQFHIFDINFNYRSSLRSNYVLQMHGEKIALSSGIPDFKTSLSEGDKRTLAFAFFIAYAESDLEVANKIIVIDDPMCSLDLKRKLQTCNVLKRLHDKCKQLIVLAHDIYFLNDFLGILRNESTNNIKCLQLKVVDDRYSELSEIDIKKKCESKYFKHHRILCEYIEGTETSSTKVAPLIRLVLEGYLRNRFPNLIDDNILFGNMIIKINEAESSHPLANAQKITKELNEINRYAGPFHHPESCPDQINSEELRVFVRRTLAVVYAGEVIL